uniref:Uncharacterized protein n=1 Tax=Tetranychus urticae TaxID=32264 RepID=T1K1H4_TETUR
MMMMMVKPNNIDLDSSIKLTGKEIEVNFYRRLMTIQKDSQIGS